MLSIQNIQNKTFEKAIFGGYDAHGVDEFMEEIIVEMSTLQKENVALKAKLKELTDKNEEYQSVETSMRKALVSAQSIANDMVEKAENERDRILKEAQEIAHEQINTYRKQINEEQEHLALIQDKTSKFVSKVIAYYEQQIKEFVNFSSDADIQNNSPSQKSDIDNFTINFSNENLNDLNSINDLQKPNKDISITENILEKIKSETIKPKVLAGSSDESAEISNIDIDSSLESEQTTQKSSKYNFSELKFGKDYSVD